MKKIVVALEIGEGVSPELFVDSVVGTYGGVKSARLVSASYSLAEVRNGTGWPAGVRFLAVHEEAWR